jgi:tetratricopeptide (TPR) repeat protein
MRYSASLLLIVILLLASFVLTAYGPSASSLSDEEREPHFLAGKSRVSALDYKGAIESFEKALEANPQSASAHFELACLFDQKEVDPAAAIYHYERYLRLRRNVENAEVVKQRILTCKQELARTVVLGPVTEKVQKELDQLTQENKRLSDENKRLHEDLDRAVAQAQKATNQISIATRSAPPPTSGAVTQVSFSTGNPPPLGKAALTSSPASRSHTVKPGETPSAIAKRYGVRLEALLAANPKLDPHRLQIGQNLVIPTS